MGEHSGDTYTVRHTVPFEDEEGKPAGVVRIGADQQIAIVSAEPAFADTLELAAETLNDTDEFALRTSPPEGQNPRSSHRRLVARDAPDARDAVIEALRADYGFELTPAG